MTPVEARKISAGLRAGGGGGDLGRQRGRLAALLAGEGVGVAGIDHEARAPCRLSGNWRGTSRPAPTGISSVVKTPATCVPSSISASMTSVRHAL
jgi:hypothetical protein